MVPLCAPHSTLLQHAAVQRNVRLEVADSLDPTGSVYACTNVTDSIPLARYISVQHTVGILYALSDLQPVSI